MFMSHSNKNLAGVLIFLGTVGSIMGIIASEALYPGYHATQMISDLGVGSTAPIFNASMVFSGVLVLTAVYCLIKGGVDIWFAALLAVIGLGQAGVGFFPETTGTPHLVAAAVVFLGGCGIAFLSARVFPAPWSWVSMLPASSHLSQLFFLWPISISDWVWEVWNGSLLIHSFFGHWAPGHFSRLLKPDDPDNFEAI